MTQILSNKSITVRTTTLVCICACLILIGLDRVVFHTVLFDPFAFQPDGAYYQYLHIESLVHDNVVWAEAQRNPITLIHIVRYSIYLPFIYLGERDIGLQYALLTLICFPVVNYYWNRLGYFFLLLPLLAAYFISYRAVLSAVSIGYIVIFLYSNRRYSFFLMGLYLSFLSSAVSFQIFLLMLVFVLFRDRTLLLKLRVSIPFAIFFVIAILGAIEKIEGFASGASGYVATTSRNAGVIIAILSRGTLYYDLIRGGLRGYAYLLIGLTLIVLLLRSLFSRDPARKEHRFVLFTLAPGFLVEGLGVTAIMMVFVWSFFKIDLSENRRKSRSTGRLAGGQRKSSQPA